MDKLNHYRTLITRFLSEYTTLSNRCSSQNGVETHTIFDETQDHYMVYRTGWGKQKRVHSAVLYVRLNNDKIYIEEDGTEDGIATNLLEAGVPKEDIVLAFHPPEMRQYTEFAVA